MRSSFSFPFQRALHPFIDKADDKNSEEYHHGDETEQADFLQHNCPGEKKGDFQIKQDKKNGDKVVAHIEFHARVFESLEAALVWGVFFTVGFAWSKDLAEN